jgi:glycosyltransferase involved in cell wall biosynthesis
MKQDYSASPVASVIIIVKNDEGVGQTLALLVPQCEAARAEVIVVDASAPEMLAGIRQKYPQVRWEYFDQRGKRFTIPEQRNCSIGLAKGKYIIFIDANCEPAEGWLDAILETLNDGEHIVCGPVRDSSEHNLVHYTSGRAEHSYLDECTTINVGFTREVYERVGQFDTRLAYGSDVDFFWRAHDAGFAICSDPRVAISHDWGQTDEQLRRAFRYGRARAILHKKHWRRHWHHLLLHEPHVWIYPLYIVGLPIALVWPYYLLFLLVPLLKNRSATLVVHHLMFGWGVLVGVFTPL